jgi:acyl carrier protein
MTAEPTCGGLTARSLVPELIGMLREVTGEDERWAAGVTAASRLERDLGLDSLELAALGERLRRVYGDQADIAAYLAGLEIDEIIGLTVGDIAAYVGAAQTARPAGMPG